LLWPGKLWTNSHAVPISCTVVSISWDPWRSTWLASDNMKQAATSCLQTLDKDFLNAGIQAWCHPGTDA
jgi:hypothetical protein